MTRLFLFFSACVILTGCAADAPPNAAPKPPEVMVDMPQVRDVTDYEVFTGRTEAAKRVELRSQVKGILETVYFQDGDQVREGDLLFLVDPKPFKAELARAEASLALALAHQRRLDGDFDRAQALISRQAISREEYEKLRGDRDEAQATTKVAESNVALAKLNLKYTEIRAPFSGRISRRLVDPGNLIKPDETLLSVLVSEELMYAYFDVDERTLLRQMLGKGNLEPVSGKRVSVAIGLADEDGFPHAGIINFVDNRLDTGTGSMWMRAQFVQPKRSVKPGMFIRVRFPLGQPYQAVLVPEQALGTDQGQKFIYVVDGQGKVEYRPVKAGRLQGDSMRVILDGLKPDEQIVVAGLQRVRAGATVTPKRVEKAESGKSPGA